MHIRYEDKINETVGVHISGHDVQRLLNGTPVSTNGELTGGRKVHVCLSYDSVAHNISVAEIRRLNGISHPDLDVILPSHAISESYLQDLDGMVIDIRSEVDDFSVKKVRFIVYDGKVHLKGKRERRSVDITFR